MNTDDYVIMVLNPATEPIAFGCRLDGRYLQDMDFEACDGRGRLTLTTHLHRAKGFPSAEAALMYWGTQSTTKPKRPDGRPNKPLTAYSVEIKRRSARGTHDTPVAIT